MPVRECAAGLVSGGIVRAAERGCGGRGSSAAARDRILRPTSDSGPPPRPSLDDSDAGAARAIAADFTIDGEFRSVRKFERGHIHDTFISSYVGSDGSERRYLHQRLNERVFRDVGALMNNVERVTQHLRTQYRHPAGSNGTEPGRMHALELVPARDGASHVRRPSGVWRTYGFIEDTRSHDLCEGPEQAYRAARAFGRFQADLADLDVTGLRMTIPSFFSSRHRLRQLEEAAARDRAGRLAAVKSELDFVAARSDMVDVIEAALRIGRFPRRVVHGDTKLNNVLFSERSGEAVCVVDLDTCMPAYSLYDFGDLVRFTAAASREDEADLSLVGTDLERYRAIVDGYLDGAAAFLSDDELRLMAFSARLVTFTIGLRFLADHLNGDEYFKIGRPGHNLDRARVQFAMVASMERQRDAMEAHLRAVGRRGQAASAGAPKSPPPG